MLKREFDISDIKNIKYFYRLSKIINKLSELEKEVLTESVIQDFNKKVFVYQIRDLQTRIQAILKEKNYDPKNDNQIEDEGQPAQHLSQAQSFETAKQVNSEALSNVNNNNSSGIENTPESIVFRRTVDIKDLNKGLIKVSDISKLKEQVKNDSNRNSLTKRLIETNLDNLQNDFREKQHSDVKQPKRDSYNSGNPGQIKIKPKEIKTRNSKQATEKVSGKLNEESDGKIQRYSSKHFGKKIGSFNEAHKNTGTLESSKLKNVLLTSQNVDIMITNLDNGEMSEREKRNVKVLNDSHISPDENDSREYVSIDDDKEIKLKCDSNLRMNVFDKDLNLEDQKLDIDSKLLTSSQLLDLIAEFYIKKKEFDSKIKDPKVSKITCEMYLIDFFQQKYGLKDLVMQNSLVFVDSVKFYADSNPDVFLFQKVSSTVTSK